MLSCSIYTCSLLIGTIYGKNSQCSTKDRPTILRWPTKSLLYLLALTTILLRYIYISSNILHYYNSTIYCNLIEYGNLIELRRWASREHEKTEKKAHPKGERKSDCVLLSFFFIYINVRLLFTKNVLYYDILLSEYCRDTMVL